MDTSWVGGTPNLTGRVNRKSVDPAFGGGFSDVWIGDFEGQAVAIKVPRFQDVPPETFLRRRKRELESWTDTTHKNILPFLGYCTDMGRHVALISPLMSNGNARDYLEHNPDADLVPLLTGVAEGIDYLHNQGIVHGDIRGANILISDSLVPLISDFGLSRRIFEMSASTQGCGSPRWMAPEMTRPEKYDLTIKEAHAKPIDVWSFGMTVLELITRKNPYSELLDERTAIRAIGEGRIPKKSFNSNLFFIWPLCLQCWVFWPNDRPTMDETLLALRKLTATEGNSNLEVYIGEVSHATSMLSTKMGSLTNIWVEKTQKLHKVAICLIMMVVVCAVDAYHRSNRWPEVFIFPMATGFTTWYVMQLDFFTYKSCEYIFDILWNIVKKASKFYWIQFGTLIVLRSLVPRRL